MSEKNEIVMYQPEGGEFHIEVRVENESVWLTQAQMAELFGVRENTITYHIKEVYASDELVQNRTTQKIRVVRLEGTRKIARTIDFYNLDMIISVGYRVNSIQGTRFRQWATGVLRDRLLHRPSANQQLQFIESRLEAKIDKHSAQISEIQEKVDFFVRTSLPPVEGVTTSPRRLMTVSC